MKSPEFRRKYIYIYIYIIYLAVLTFYVWMAAQIPYTHDDWDWGSAVGMEQLLHATVNSRYVGNFFEVVMTRSEFLKVAIMGLSYFLIPFLLMQIAAKDRGIVAPNRKLLLFLLCNCLLLTMNHIMWREVYGWTAGFANFGISALFLLLWLKELLKAFDREPEDKKDSLGKGILYLVASFCGQLFIENLAIYCVLLAFVLCGIYYHRLHRVPNGVIAMGIGAVGGLIVMFSSNIYQSLFTTGYAVGGVRSIPILSYGSVLAGIYELLVIGLNLGRELYANNIVLTITVLLVCTILMKSSQYMTNRSVCSKATLINSILIFSFVICHIYDRSCENHLTSVYLMDFIVSIAYFLTVGIEVFLCFRKELRGKLLMLWLSPPVLIAPILVTTEHGQRLFFTTNILVLAFVLLIVVEMLDSVTVLMRKRIGGGVLGVALLLFSFYGGIYADIGACKTEREDRIDQAVQTEQKEIFLPAFPHQDYLHYPDTDVNWRVDYFKEFYGIPADVELVFESLNHSSK